MKRAILPALLVLLLQACDQPHRPEVVVRAMYHWSNSDDLFEQEEHFLDTHQVGVLLWKVLDIDWNEANHAHPVSIVRSPFIPNEWGYGGGRTARTDSVAFIPVVFITNRTMLNCDSMQLEEFAAKLQRKLAQLCGADHEEIQFDCDWSAGSRDTYFRFLRMVRARTGKRLSATVRLHQYRDPRGTGVPPVDRGMLMVYNVADVKRPDPANAIFNVDAARPYFRGAPTYPLPLDIALPAYSWVVHFRGGRFLGIDHGSLIDELDSLPNFQRDPDGSYRVVQEQERWWGNDLHIGDVLKADRVDSTTIAHAVELARQAVNTDTVRIAFFDLPETPRKGIAHRTYEQAWEAFR